jgi:hypothetical protein
VPFVDARVAVALSSSGSASDSRSTLGFRSTASLGLSVDARIAVISLGGFARYDSRFPELRIRSRPVLHSPSTRSRPRASGSTTASPMAGSSPFALRCTRLEIADAARAA